MATLVHFINVGQGNMTLLRLASGQTFLYDCNVTNENEDEVLGYVAKQIGWGSAIDVFICSHRDADHMRGVKKVNHYFPIKRVWDSGVTGTTGRLRTAPNIVSTWTHANFRCLFHSAQLHGVHPVEFVLQLANPALVGESTDMIAPEQRKKAA